MIARGRSDHPAYRVFHVAFDYIVYVMQHSLVHYKECDRYICRHFEEFAGNLVSI